MSESKPARSLKERAAEEMREFLIMFLYLWLLFGLFVLNERIILQQSGLSLFSQGFAAINALVLAKVMLIADGLKFGHRLHHKPLLYSTLYKAMAFALLFIIFHVVEQVVIGLFKGESAAAAVPLIGGGGVGGLICVTLILFVALIPFFAFRDLSRVLGPEKLRELVLGT